MTAKGALDKCLSEAAERKFEITELLKVGIEPLGIAAHLNTESATEAALQEAAEELCLREIKRTGILSHFFKFSIGKGTYSLSKTSIGYFGIIRDFRNGTWIITHTAKRGLLATFLKLWNEHQTIRFFKPSKKWLLIFSKANKIFSQQEIKSLLYKRNETHQFKISINDLQFSSINRDNREIVFVVSKEETKHEKNTVLNFRNLGCGTFDPPTCQPRACS